MAPTRKCRGFGRLTPACFVLRRPQHVVRPTQASTDRDGPTARPERENTAMPDHQGLIDIPIMHSAAVLAGIPCSKSVRFEAGCNLTISCALLHSAGHPALLALHLDNWFLLNSPAYHGSMSGALENAGNHLATRSVLLRRALDRLELSTQATYLVSVAHALRTILLPFGYQGRFAAAGTLRDELAAMRFHSLGPQVVTFVRAMAPPQQCRCRLTESTHSDCG
jgi:hypothetical protein